MRKIADIFSGDGFWGLLKRIIAINAVFAPILLLLNIFIDFQEIHKKLSFDNFIEYQAAATIAVFLLEILLISFSVGWWFHSKRAAGQPVYANCAGREEFFVRVAVATQPLSIKEAHEYIKTRWKK